MLYACSLINVGVLCVCLMNNKIKPLAYCDANVHTCSSSLFAFLLLSPYLGVSSVTADTLSVSAAQSMGTSLGNWSVQLRLSTECDSWRGASLPPGHN